MQVATILEEAYRKLGRPSQTDMPFIDLIAIVREVYRGLALDMRLSARGHATEVGAWAVPTGREMSASVFTQGDFIAPVKCEWRPIDAVEAAYPVEIVSYESIDDSVARMDKPSVAFLNGFADVRFSDTENVLFGREYRFTYEPLNDVDVDSVTDLVFIPELFVSYLADEAAVRALDHISGGNEWAEKRERLRGVLTASLMENKIRFNKWRMTQFGNKKVKKMGVPLARNFWW